MANFNKGRLLLKCAQKKKVHLNSVFILNSSDIWVITRWKLRRLMIRIKSFRIDAIFLLNNSSSMRDNLNFFAVLAASTTNTNYRHYNIETTSSSYCSSYNHWNILTACTVYIFDTGKTNFIVIIIKIIKYLHVLSICAITRWYIGIWRREIFILRITKAYIIIN